MKGSEFINLMRKVIREEVRTVVKEELKALKPLLMEKQQPTVTKKPPTLPIIGRSMPIAVLSSKSIGFILISTAIKRGFRSFKNY